MGKTLAVRVDDRLVRQVEAVRDPDLYPTQSDFVREAVKRMVREERRRRVAAEIDEAMKDPEEVRLAEAFAEANIRELAERLAEIEGQEGRQE